MSKDAWRDTGWYLEADGSRDLFAKIGSIGGYSSNAQIAWRGVASIDYRLTSSLQRAHPGIDELGLRELEQDLIAAAREWGLGFGPGGWSGDLQVLADLQHYGISTRLLDVTSNPMTALWFACQPVDRAGAVNRVAEDGLLLAINTEGWRRFGRGMPASSYSALENPLTWELKEALDSGTPFVVESLVPNERLRAQEGFFLAGRVPGHELRGPFESFELDWEPTSTDQLKRRLTRPYRPGQSGRDHLPFVAIVVPAKYKQRIRTRLANSYNRKASVLFPDFFGFGQFSPQAAPRRPLGEQGESGIPRSG